MSSESETETKAEVGEKDPLRSPFFGPEVVSLRQKLGQTKLKQKLRREREKVVSEYRSHEDPNSSQVVVIKHQDTERPGNYAQKQRGGQAPAVWGIAFSCDEPKELSASIIAGASTKGTLIHREPEGDVDAEQPWFSESHWLIEGGKITGIKLVCSAPGTKCPERSS